MRDQVHIWVARPDRLEAEACTQRMRTLLTDEEHARVARYHFAHHRHAALVTRALVRSALSHYADVAPTDWRFVATDAGRPEIAAPDRHPSLRFNLSHTAGLIVCAVNVTRDVGCDVESLDRKTPLDQLAERYFSPVEAAELRACAESDRAERFFRYWTLKEAYMKARGLGLRIPLGSFSLSFGNAPLSADLEHAAPARISFHEPEPHRGFADPAAWQLATMSVGGEHVLSWAAYRPDRADLAIRLVAYAP